MNLTELDNETILHALAKEYGGTIRRPYNSRVRTMGWRHWNTCYAIIYEDNLIISTRPIKKPNKVAECTVTGAPIILFKESLHDPNFLAMLRIFCI